MGTNTDEVHELVNAVRLGLVREKGTSGPLKSERPVLQAAENMLRPDSGVLQGSAAGPLVISRCSWSGMRGIRDVQ